MCVNERKAGGMVRLQLVKVKKVHEFIYIGSTVQGDEEWAKQVETQEWAGWAG